MLINIYKFFEGTHPDTGITAVYKRRRFEPRSHLQWRIVEISNRPINLSAKQSELTVRTKKRP